MSPRQRVRLLESLTPDGITNEIRSAEIDFHVAQAFRVITKTAIGSIDCQELDSDAADENTWTHFHVLTWYSRRFCPVSYFEMGGDPGASLAIVALNSPETKLASFVSGREQSPGRPYFQLTHFLRQLARNGSSQALTLVRGDGLAGEARYFTDWSLRSRGRGQPDIKEFDLTFVDGSGEQAGVYRALKNGFARCALGGMVVFRGMNRPEASLPGQYCPRLCGYWERLPLRFPGFRFLKAPRATEIGLAYRMA
jgi:hypothetical protein